MNINGKKIINSRKQIELNKQYDLIEAIILAKKVAYANFIESIDLNLHLDIDIKKNQQLIKGVITLPYKIGKYYKVLYLTNKYNISVKLNKTDKIQLTLGNIDIINKIKIDKKINFNLIIASSEIINDVNKIASILGPKGLMPSERFKTITNDIQDTINYLPYEVRYNLNDVGNILVKIGNLLQSNNEIKKNIIFFIKELINQQKKIIKKINLTKIGLSTTMGPNIFINPNIFNYGFNI